MNNLFLTALLPLLAAGCTTFTQNVPHKEAQDFTTIGTSRITFYNLRVETNPDGKSILKGSLRRFGRKPVRFGHLDYTVTDTNSNVLESGVAAYSGEIKRRLPLRRSRFAIPLQQAWQPGLHQIAVAFHDKPH